MKIHRRGKSRAEKRQKHYIQKHRQHIKKGHIEPHLCQIQKTEAEGDYSHDPCGDRRGTKVADGQSGCAHRRDSQVLYGAGDLVLHHQQIGTEGNRHTGDRQKGGNQLSADHSIDQRFVHRKVPHVGKKAVLKGFGQKGNVQH